MEEVQDPLGNTVVPLPPPRDYERVYAGVVALRRAFATCGLEPPAAILVSLQQFRVIESIMGLAPMVAAGSMVRSGRGELVVGGIAIRPDA